jgi:hydrogenase expression/formation protein HypC
MPMCVAVPMEVVRVEGTRALVRSGGAELEISLALVDEVRVGDHVIVHAGLAIQVLDRQEALERLAILHRILE